MGSRKEEERNEKIIRGLMKLPPNRRCINCNSLGPQYVCTNFWTFVCMTCSGIHREFTHRVKSVSMAKFTSQEVDALQNGGNQRAREIYLKDWDFQRQRLPDNSNVNKVRDFIKAVYVDKRYAGGKTSEKPPKDTQGLGSCEDMTRRASSYHSYSQSPPYDYQYEDRRYGKLGAALTRKPGSDRGHHIGKISSFVYSPGRMSEQMFEDRFANEGSGSRMSDYSVSSGSDPFRSGAQSPNFEKDAGFNSPPIQPSRDSLSSITNFKRDINGIPRPQRTTSLGSIGSFDSNSISLKSYHSGGLSDVVSEPEQAAGAHRDKVSAIPQSYGPVNYGGLDLFQAPIVPGPVSSPAPPIDLFNLPATSLAPVNTFQTPQASSSPSINSYQPSRSTTTLDRNPQELSNSKNEGWATFDTSSPAATIPVAESLSPVTAPGNGVSSVKFDQFPSSNTGTQWQAFQNSGAHSHGPALSSDPWFDSFHNVQAPAIATNTQSWNAFDKSTNHLPLDGVKQISEPQLAAYEPSSSADQSWNAFAVSTSHLPLDGVKQNCEPQSWNAFDAFTSHLPLDGDMQNNEPQLQNSEPQSGNAFDDSTSHFPLDGVKQNNEPKLQNSEPQSWNAFADSTSHLPLDGVKQNSEPELAAYEPPLTANQYLSSIISQDSNIDGNLRPASLHGPPGLPIPSHVDMGPSYTPSVLPVMGVMQAHATEHKSTNPFDFPYDSDLEQSNMFLDMSSLQAALPNAVQSWFPQNPAAPFIPAAAQGGLPYMSGQAPTAQLPNVPTQEPVASVGGNPFA